MKTLADVLNETKTKTPAQMEMEHKDTAEWFAEELASLLSASIGDSSDGTWDVDKESKKILPEYFNRIVKDHEKEFKNYYTWLKWMEEKMKKYSTPEEYENDK